MKSVILLSQLEIRRSKTAKEGKMLSRHGYKTGKLKLVSQYGLLISTDGDVDGADEDNDYMSSYNDV